MAGLESLRDGAHTGENRCWPCTAINLLLLGLAALLIRVRGRRWLAMLVATAGVAVIHLRGYLVPGTPQFAPQLVAASPLPDEWFDHDADPAAAGSFADAVALDGEAVLEALLEAGVVAVDGEMLYLTAAVEDDWHARMDDLAALSLADLAAAVERSLPTVSQCAPLESDGADWVTVGADGTLVARPVAVAELAAHDVLGDHLSDEQARLAAAETFRTFLETCPVCDTALAESSEVSCCGGYTRPTEKPRETLVCPTCEQRVYTFPAE